MLQCPISCPPTHINSSHLKEKKPTVQPTTVQPTTVQPTTVQPPTFRENLFTDCSITEPESEPSLPPTPEQLRQIGPSHETSAQLSFNPLFPCNATQDLRLESTYPSTSSQPSTSDLVLLSRPLSQPLLPPSMLVNYHTLIRIGNVVSNEEETIIMIFLKMIMVKTTTHEVRSRLKTKM